MCLNKLIMCSFYESLGLDSLELKKISSLIFGSIWLLQLWLNVTFEPSLKVYTPNDLARLVKGIRLEFLTQEDIGLSIKKSFRKYSSRMCIVPRLFPP